jgi:hypothetical protein
MLDKKNAYEILREKIKNLYAIVHDLENQFPGRRFTPDGHLVGSIGEVLAASQFGLKLLPASTEIHDAISPCGKKVQIKATQIERVSFYSEPEYLIVLKILPDGNSIVLYNGPGKPAWDSAGKLQKNGQRSISAAKLKIINQDIPSENKLKHI